MYVCLSLTRNTDSQSRDGADSRISFAFEKKRQPSVCDQRLESGVYSFSSSDT